MIIDKLKLYNQGYLFCNLHDIDKDLYEKLFLLFDKENEIKKTLNLRFDGSIIVNSNTLIIDNLRDYINNLCVQYNLDLQLDIDSNSQKGHDNKEHIPINLKVKGDYNSLNNFYKKIEQISYNISQSWFFFNDYTNNKNLNPILKNIYQKTILNLYSDNIKNIHNYSDEIISKETTLTLYKKGNFIEPHEDGYVKGRLCVFLIYLNDDYKDGYGGELVVNKSTTIKPEFGNIVIFDFTKNNILHSVNPVLDDNFKRFAYLKIFNE